MLILICLHNALDLYCIILVLETNCKIKCVKCRKFSQIDFEISMKYQEKNI